MQATRDFYQKRASELTTLAERAKSKDHRSDLLALAQAWRDLACGWEVDQAPPRPGGFVLRQEKSPAEAGLREPASHKVTRNGGSSYSEEPGMEIL
jgi:hypothetical protein